MRCLTVKINGKNANIDWGSNKEKAASASISAPDGGRVEIFITNFADTDKAIILQALSTFKFTK